MQTIVKLNKIHLENVIGKKSSYVWFYEITEYVPQVREKSTLRIKTGDTPTLSLILPPIQLSPMSPVSLLCICTLFPLYCRV